MSYDLLERNNLSPSSPLISLDSGVADSSLGYAYLRAVACSSFSLQRQLLQRPFDHPTNLVSFSYLWLGELWFWWFLVVFDIESGVRWLIHFSKWLKKRCRVIESPKSGTIESPKSGEGGFGPIYKGTLPSGTEIAIKMLRKGLVKV